MDNDFQLHSYASTCTPHVCTYTHVQKKIHYAWGLESPRALPLCLTLPPLFQNKCVPYWPEVGTQRVYGLYSVTNCAEHDTAEYKLRTLQISPLDNVSVPSPCTLQQPRLLFVLGGWVD